ncbi:MAG: hypothetical protein RLZZ28_2357 [Bacteroidota bacterium]
MQRVKAIFVSHEHSDHITGIPALSKKFRLPVYITEATLANSPLPIEPALIVPFLAHIPVSIGSLLVTAFPKYHDAADPHSFMVSSGNINIGIFTDLGIGCEQLIHYFKQCHAAFLEANYDVKMLENGNYPYHLKKRISGGLGHLSNEQALDLFLRHRSPDLSHLLLAHLSKNNNRPEIVENLFKQHAQHIHIAIASRYSESALYFIDGKNEGKSFFPNRKNNQQQLSLFE